MTLNGHKFKGRVESANSKKLYPYCVTGTVVLQKYIQDKDKWKPTGVIDNPGSDGRFVLNFGGDNSQLGHGPGLYRAHAVGPQGSPPCNDAFSKPKPHVHL